MQQNPVTAGAAREDTGDEPAREGAAAGPAREGAAAELAQEIRAGCVGLRIGRLHRIVARRFDQSLRPLGLTLPQLEALSALALIGHPVRPGVLADYLAVERSTMSRNLAGLEERGWARTAERSPTGRSMTFEIAGPGTEVLAQAGEAWREAQAAVTTLLGADAPAQLDSWLGVLA